MKKIKKEWQGLWVNKSTTGREIYVSKPIKKGDLELAKTKEKHLRLIVCKNKYWKKDSIYPKFTFIFASTTIGDNGYIEIGNSEKDSTLDDYGNYQDENGNRLFTKEEVRKIINGTVRDVQYGITEPYDILPEDFV